MKFSIRDLFLVTVIVAVCVAWWLDRSRLTAEVKRQRDYELRFFYQLPNSSAPDPNPAKP